MTTPAPTRLPSPLLVGLHRGLLEIKQFFRERDSVAFTFAMPIAFMALLTAIFGDQPLPDGLAYTQVLVPAMLTFGIASTTLVNVGVWIAVDRDNGTLRRLCATPMPRISYFIGKIAMMVVVGVIESAMMLGIGVLAFDLELPATGAKLLTAVWVILLSFAVCGALGVALSSLPRSSRSASAVINLPVLLLQFVSGIFIPYDQIPGWLYDISALFPLKWIAQGLRAAFLPDALSGAEAAGAWELDRVFLVLAGWLVLALVLCLTTFRWKRRGDG